MARQLMPQRDRVGASLLAAIACNSELFGPARDDNRRRLDKCIPCIPAKLRFERAAAILRVIDSPQLHELLALFPINEDQREKVTEKLLSFAGEDV